MIVSLGINGWVASLIGYALVGAGCSNIVALYCCRPPATYATGGSHPRRHLNGLRGNSDRSGVYRSGRPPEHVVIRTWLRKCSVGFCQCDRSITSTLTIFSDASSVLATPTRHIALAATTVLSGETRQRRKKDFSLDEKNGPLFRDPFFNAWSGKRDSYLASNQLKSKVFLFFPEQEKTQFWTCFLGVSRAKKE
jgi:hypothetical protein